MAGVSTTVGGAVVGLTNPWFLLVLPLALVGAWYLAFRSRGLASARSRRLLFAARAFVVVCLVLAAAGPYTVVTRESTGDPNVTLLVDRSDSMAVSPDAAETIAANVEDQGVPVTTVTVGDGTDSRIGDGVVANLQENGSLVLLSDGQVTGGRSLAVAAETARSLNATVSTVRLSPDETERYVTLHGPAKTSAGVQSTFLARVDGVRLEEGATPTLSVSVDGEEVATRQLDGGGGALEVTHTFDAVGSHRITATVSGDDVYDTNDVFRKTVRVVEQPKILYVSRGSYPLQGYLSNLYDVDTAQSVPANLDPYYAVVLQDVAAGDAGNVDALQEFVIDGNGLFVVGGDNSFEQGNYEGSAVASMLPVNIGESAGGSTNLVLAIDVSGSAESGMQVQKAVALSALNQLGDENDVGLVAFNYRAYRVADLQPLSENRNLLEDRIKRLQSGGATSISSGLYGAEELLGDEQGTVILISDGHDRIGESATAAATLGSEGIQVIAIGTGPSPNADVLRRVAGQSGGVYLRATETNRLRIFFGGASRRFQGEKLTIVDPNSFVTSGVTLESNPARANDVSMKRGAEFLVATSEGTPAVASWRYGLGRVVTVTAYGDDGTLDGLLQRPDSLLVTKATNYAIGDPERKADGVTDVADARVGEPTTATYRGDARPEGAPVAFRQTSPGRYQATVTPAEAGYATLLDAEYAVNYPAEYGGFGRSPELDLLVENTGGRTFLRGQADEIAAFATQQSTRVRDVRQEWTWLFLLAGFVAFLVEVIARRIQVYTGRSRSEGGLT